MIRNIEISGCIKCGLCEIVCPGDVIRITEDGFPVVAYQGDCWTCFNCELVCPAAVVDVAPYRKAKPLAW